MTTDFRKQLATCEVFAILLAMVVSVGFGQQQADPTFDARTVSAAGRAQALALPFGAGRVVVFGEAAMLTAQNVNFGMNYPGTDDRQLALNVMHWLTGLLK